MAGARNAVTQHVRPDALGEVMVGQQSIIVLEQREVDRDRLPHLRVEEMLGEVVAGGLVGDLLAEGGEVVLARGVLDVREQLGALAHEVAATAQEVSGGPHLPRVDVGRVGIMPPRSSTAILWASIRSFFALPP
jgi:hypothetical protein